MTRPSLEVPVKDQLTVPTDDAAVARVWREVVAQQRPASVWLRAGWAVAAAALIGLALNLGWPPANPSSPYATLAGGGALASAPLSGSAPVRHRLADGSEIRSGAGAGLALKENGEERLGFLLERGSVSFDVTPGHRIWSIDCGLATVTVLGTAFVLHRFQDRLEVSVSRGRVRVDGATVPGGSEELTAGQTLTVNAIEIADEAESGGGPPAATIEDERPPQPELPLVPSSSPSNTAESEPPAKTAGKMGSREVVQPSTSPRLAASGASTQKAPRVAPSSSQKAPSSSQEAASWIAPKPAAPSITPPAVFDEATSESSPPASSPRAMVKNAQSTPSIPTVHQRPAVAPTLQALLQTSDRQRLQGNVDGAIESLRTLLDRYPNRAESGLAAFTLGRLFAEARQDPEAAAPYLVQALEIGLPNALQAQAMKRLVAAYEALGNGVAAEAWTVRLEQIEGEIR